jgi:hypothetical protein
MKTLRRQPVRGAFSSTQEPFNSKSNPEAEEMPQRILIDKSINIY